MNCPPGNKGKEAMLRPCRRTQEIEPDGVSRRLAGIVGFEL